MRVAIYLRVSTQKQAEAHTIEQQRERLTSYAIQHGWAVSPENIFRDEGYSGASLKRPGLDHLRDRVAAAELDRIFITAPDRLARNYVHQVLLLEELERFGCQVEFLDRPMSQDPHDQLLLQIRGAVAEYERSLIAERMRRGRQRKLSAGLLLPWTRPPYGYRVDPEQPRHPAGVRQEGSEAAVVASIFARYTEGGVSLCGIARQLQQEGVPTPQGKPHWGGSTVRQILRNPVYTGQLYANRVRSTPAQGRCSALRPIRQHSSRAKEQPREEWLALGTVPAIIREDQYVRAQNRMALNQSFSPRSHKAETYLLRALVSCGACRLACTGRTMNGRYEYYWCKGKLSLAQSCLIERCPARYIPAQQLDELVWLDLCQLLEHPDMIHQALEQAQSGCWLPQEMQAHREQLSRGEKAITNQQERLTEAYLSGVIQLEEYGRRRQDLEQRKSALSQQQRQLEAQAGQQTEVAAMASSIEDFCQRVQAGLAQATFRQKRQLVELLIDRVVVTEEQVEIRYVIPTHSRAEHTRFSQLRTDYRDGRGARCRGGAEYDSALSSFVTRQSSSGVGRHLSGLWDGVGERMRRIASDITAAKAFFRKALKHHGEPRTIALDGFEPSHAALRRMGMNHEFHYRWKNSVKIRSCQYLHTVVEQDHRRIKFRIRPMLGFKSFYNARRVLMGIELVKKIVKGQYQVPARFGSSLHSIWHHVLAS